MYKISLILFFCLVFTGCNNQDDFYSEYQVEDLWRLPLVKPYEAKTVVGARKKSIQDNWGLNFKQQVKVKDSLYITWVNLTKVNVNRNIVYGYGTANPCYPFIINIKDSTEKIYFDKKVWERTLDSLGINHENLYDAFEVFDDFKSNGHLPWKEK
jgi:hypothetical protein